MMMPGSGGGFADLNGQSQMRRIGQFGTGGGQPMPGPMPSGKGTSWGGAGSVGISPSQQTGGGGPAPMPAPALAKPATPFGQANDPGAYGTPGAPGSSPLGMWQSWLNTMGPYLAQMPVSEPGVETGGLSSLIPGQSTPGTMRGYAGPDTPWQGNRGFKALSM